MVMKRRSEPPPSCAVGLGVLVLGYVRRSDQTEVPTKRELVRTPCSLATTQLWHSRAALAGRRDELPKIATFLPVVPRGGTNARAARYALGGALPS